MSKKTVAIGIDLGTTKCCVGVVINGKVEILENDHANKLTPSCVAFTDTERLVGEAAKDQAARNPTNTVSGIKRIMGRTLDDSTLQEMAKNVPYTLCKMDGETCLSVTYKKKHELLIPQQISAMLLNKMKELAEARLECRVEEVVISVPSSFTNAQRQATKDAATIAGLKVLALVNESTAAAIAYNANRNESAEETIAVVDLGGGTIDTCIAVVRSGSVDIKAVSGSTAIGGIDIDEALKQHFKRKFKEKHRRDPPKGDSITEQLFVSCEKLKRALTFSQVAQDQWNFVEEVNVFRASIRKDEFSQLVTSKIFPHLEACLNRALAVSGIAKCKISRVILVGGTSRIPVIQKNLFSFFISSSLDKSLNPDEAVAQGAAIYASSLSGTGGKLHVHDKIHSGFLMANLGSDNSELIFEKSKTMIPSTKKVFLRDEMVFNKKCIYEQDSCRKDSKLLIGTFCLTEEFAKAAHLVTSVTFEINECGIFDVSAHFDPDHVIRDILKKHSFGLGNEKVRNAIKREAQFKKDNQAEELRIFALADLESKCYKIRCMTQNIELNEHFTDVIDRIKMEVSKTIDWLEDTEIVTTDECNKKMNFLMGFEKTLRKKIKELEKIRKKLAIYEVFPEEYAWKIPSLEGNLERMNDNEVTFDKKLVKGESHERLQSVPNASQKKADVNSKTPEKLYQIFQRKLESREKERDRIAAVNHLWEYCLELRSMMLGFQASEHHQDKINELIEQSKLVTMWLSSRGMVSKEECEAKKASLSKLLYKIEKSHQKTVAKRYEEECGTAVKSLRTCCQDLRSLLLNFKHELDSELIIFVSNAVESVIRWLGDGKTVLKSNCEAKQLELENLKKTLEETLKEQHLTAEDC